MNEILDSDDDTRSEPQLKFWTLTMIHGHSYDWNFRLWWWYMVTGKTKILDSDDTQSEPQLKFWTLTMMHGHSYDWNFGFWWWYIVTVTTDILDSDDDTRSQAQVIFWTTMMIHGHSHNWNIGYYYHRLKNHMVQTRYASYLQVEWGLDRIYCGGPIRNGLILIM
jgi:hypothetical protein